VLSTPKATSPVGSSLVSTSLLVRAPASPLCRMTSLRPKSFSNFAFSSFGRLKESWVTRTTCSEPLSEASSSLPPLSEQDVSARTVVIVIARARLRIVTPFAGANRSRFGGSAAVSALSARVAGSPV